MKILVIQNKMIGDVLTSTVICTNLKQNFPSAQVDFMIYKHTLPVVEHNPFIDNVIIFEEKYRKSKISLLKFLLAIRKKKYDVVIDVYGKIESNLVVLFSGAQKKIGLFRKQSSFLFTDTIQENFVPTSLAGAAINNRLNLLSPLHLKLTLVEKPLIYLTKDEINNGKKTLLEHGVDLSKKIFMISILGSEPRKTYPKEYMAQLLDFIVKETQATLLFNYMPSQQNEVEKIIGLCNETTVLHSKLALQPTSIRNFLSITYHCDALIGNEGGAINMSKAINIPCFTIFSPWIIKEAWNSFENGTTNVSVHLQDFMPELYEQKHAFEFKNNAIEMYQLFIPNYIYPKLKTFISQ
jgi:heptosyltransferase-2